LDDFLLFPIYTGLFSNYLLLDQLVVLMSLDRWIADRHVYSRTGRVMEWQTVAWFIALVCVTQTVRVKRQTKTTYDPAREVLTLFVLDELQASCSGSKVGCACAPVCSGAQAQPTADRHVYSLTGRVMEWQTVAWFIALVCAMQAVRVKWQTE
jgi:hypothetical protein